MSFQRVFANERFFAGDTGEGLFFGVNEFMLIQVTESQKFLPTFFALVRSLTGVPALMRVKFALEPKSCRTFGTTKRVFFRDDVYTLVTLHLSLGTEFSIALPTLEGIRIQELEQKFSDAASSSRGLLRFS